MKVFFANNKHHYPKSDKEKSITYCYHHQGEICIARRYFKLQALPQNAMIKHLQGIALDIWKSLPQRIKADFARYARAYKKHYPQIRREHLSNYSIFLKVIHHIEKAYHFSYLLESIQQDSLNQQLNYTAYDLYKQLFSKVSVFDFILKGFLPFIPRTYKLNARIEPMTTITQDKDVIHELLNGNVQRGLQTRCLNCRLWPVDLPVETLHATSQTFY